MQLTEQKYELFRLATSKTEAAILYQNPRLTSLGM